MINEKVGKVEVYFNGIELRGVTSAGPIFKKENILERLINKRKLKRITKPIIAKFKIKNKLFLNDLDVWNRIKSRIYKKKSYKKYKRLNMKKEIFKDFVNNIIERGKYEQ